MVSVKPLIAWKLALCIYRFWEGIHAVLLYNSARKKTTNNNLYCSASPLKGYSGCLRTRIYTYLELLG